MRSQADIEAIESVPLGERLRVDDFCGRVDLAIAERLPEKTAIFYVEDGDVHRPAEEISFATLRANIDRTAALLRAQGINRTDFVAVLLPAVPATY